MPRRASRREAGFIIIWGFRTRITDDGYPTVQMKCPACQQEAVFRGRQIQKWFTLFFIPVCPMGGADRFCECMACGQQLRRTVDQLARMGGFTAPASTFVPREGPAGDNPIATAMRMHHEMLANPEDSQRLLKLVKHYLAMNELSDAKAACRAFPKAYENDPAVAEAMRVIA